jgi:group II intron reverse transcriptase/maturase
MTDTSGPETISARRERIAELARQMPEAQLYSLSRHMDQEWMREAYRLTRKDGAVGIDGQTARDYASDLDARLADLLDRAKAGTYFAPPVRRVWIPKGDGRERPIGIPTFEDKVLQRAVAMVLESVYEQDFLPVSYGFRPGRSAHEALEDLRNGIMATWGGWVLEADIQGFFDHLDHHVLMDIVRQRVTDGVIGRLIRKWLHAGVMEDGALRRPEAGTPQGGVISPILANIYLHEVLDTWFVGEVLPRLRGQARLVRYADDFVVVFEVEQDARRVMEVLPKRMARYGLTLHPDKTRLVPFLLPGATIRLIPAITTAGPRDGKPGGGPHRRARWRSPARRGTRPVSGGHAPSLGPRPSPGPP